MAVKVAIMITDRTWRDLRCDGVFPDVECDAVVEGDGVMGVIAGTSVMRQHGFVLMIGNLGCYSGASLGKRIQ